MHEDSISSYSGIIVNKVADQEASGYFKKFSHNLVPDTDGSEVNLGYPDWILPVFIVVFMILAWVRVYHIKRVKLLVNALIIRLPEALYLLPSSYHAELFPCQQVLHLKLQMLENRMSK